MFGKVRAVKPYNGLVAVETAANEFSLLKLRPDDDVRVGDVISGDLASPGGAKVKNETQSAHLDVDILDCGCDTRRLMALM